MKGDRSLRDRIAAAICSDPALFRGSLWWMVPAWIAGRVRPDLRRATDADAFTFGRYDPRLVGAALPLIAIVLALVPSVIHATGTRPFSVAQVDYFRIRVDNVYTESIPFMAGSLILGLLSPALGAFLVLVFGALDLVAASRHTLEITPLLPAILGRLISYWLLWFLAVEIPTFARALAASYDAGRLGRASAALVGALATGVFAWLWTLAAPVLIRPLHTLAYLRTPQVAAIYPLQVGGWSLALVGAIAAALLVAARGPGSLLAETAAGLPPAWSRRAEVAIALRLVVAAFLTVCLLGIISGPLDALLLFAALAGARPLARFLMERLRLDRLTDRLPAAARVALAVGVAFVAASVIVPRFYSVRDETFFSIVVGIIAAMFAAELVSVDRGEKRVPSRAPSPAATGVLGGLLLLGLSVLVPTLALADNCADPADCYGLGAGAAMAAGGAGAMLSSRRNPPRDDDAFKKRKLDYIDKQIQREREHPSFPDEPHLQKSRNDYLQHQHDYWSSDAEPSSDNKPTSSQAFTSSGAATKG